MFARMMKRGLRVPAKIVSRGASGTTVRDGVFKGKDIKNIWLGDAGAYPVMVGIAWCCFFCTSFGIYYASTSPDVRLIGESRRRLFRGELGKEYMKPS
jgi:hypothetical protein